MLGLRRGRSVWRQWNEPLAGAYKQFSNASKAAKSKITPRDVNYSLWYNDVIKEADLVDSSPTRGCLIIKPWAMSIWDTLKDSMDKKIKAHGCENAYFPLLIPQSFFTKEAEHIKGFAKECAVVTHSRLTASTSGNSDVVQLVPDPASKLEEALIIRPTSETVIWSSFGKWISSHRDLPMKLNQWCNVLRWEMRTRPFLRTSEFLWQEGHSAHATRDCALGTTKHMLQAYADVCRDVLALPVVQGVKSPMERFAGADDTFTIEGLMQNGWALQCGTSHFLGQNFGRAFDVYFQTDKANQDAADRELVWGTSFGVSTRLVGAMIMTHSDDKGLVCPPPVAPVQIVLVPLYAFNKDSSPEGVEETNRTNAAIDAHIARLTVHFSAHDIRYKVDSTDTRPGVKYYKWERKGVPVRISIGARECVASAVECVLRHDSSVSSVAVDNAALSGAISPFKELLASIHGDMYAKAEARMVSRSYYVSSYGDLKAMLVKQTTGDNGKNEKKSASAAVTEALTNVVPVDAEDRDGVDSADACSYASKIGFYLAPWKCNEVNELRIKEELKLTIRCYPLDASFAGVPALADDSKCFYSGEPATHVAMFARAY